MKRTLHLCMALLLGMAALPSYGQEQEGNPETPIVINTLQDLMSIESGSYVEIKIDSVFCTFGETGLNFLRDKTGGVLVKNLLFAQGYYYNCDFIGKLTRDRGMPEISEASGTKTQLVPEDEYYMYGEEYKPISTGEYWDNLGNLVYMTLDHEDYIIEDMINSVFVNGTRKTFNSKNYKIVVAGIAYPTSDGKERIVFTRSVTFNVYLNDEEGVTDYIPRVRIWAERPIKGRKWNTVCVPFKVVPVRFGTCATFVSAADGVLNFKTTTYDIPAGTPFLLKPNSVGDVSSFGGSDWVELKPISAKYKNGGEYSFVGTFIPVQPIDGSYYLTEGNTIKPLASGGTIKGFRAYFKPNYSSAAMARAISIDGMTTAIEDIEWGDGNPFLAPTDNCIYNLEGQMVGNNLEQLPKGLYIVNGKKVIK